jgi:prepilin-type N-terminal cleavage/methylation domain-containing protein
MLKKPFMKSGFTPIEMSIVLVIIGLITGGILAGQDLIKAAGIRATISQLENFNTATYTFVISMVICLAIFLAHKQIALGYIMKLGCWWWGGKRFELWRWQWPHPGL